MAEKNKNLSDLENQIKKQLDRIYKLLDEKKKSRIYKIGI